MWILTMDGSVGTLENFGYITSDYRRLATPNPAQCIGAVGVDANAWFLGSFRPAVWPTEEDANEAAARIAAQGYGTWVPFDLTNAF